MPPFAPPASFRTLVSSQRWNPASGGVPAITRSHLTRAAVLIGATGAVLACAASDPEVSSAMWNTLSGTRPIVIAHRGASAHRPPHTLEAYELGADLGADYIEPDLVLTKDDVLVCRHDRYLGTTTNVADHPEFADRQVEKGGRVDWWVEDFTLAEIKTLRARQDDPRRSTEHDDQFLIPTFEEVIALARRKTRETGRVIGIYPEPKRTAEFSALGKDLVSAVVRALEDAGWTGADAPVIVQSFEPPVLEALNERIDVPLVQLMSPRSTDDPTDSPESELELEGVAAYADGVGPSQRLIVSEEGRVTDFIERAHALGLRVHAWTLSGDRDSPDGLSPEDETRRLYLLGVDGVFADDPGQAVRVRRGLELSG